MNTENKNRLFVTAVVSNSRKINNAIEYAIIGHIREKLLCLILTDGVGEAQKECKTIIQEETGRKPVKGNIHYFAETAHDNPNCIEIVRAAHGGGNNRSARDNGGVVIATVIAVKIRGELSPVHGLTWYKSDGVDSP